MYVSKLLFQTSYEGRSFCKSVILGVINDRRVDIGRRRRIREDLLNENTNRTKKTEGFFFFLVPFIEITVETRRLCVQHRYGRLCPKSRQDYSLKLVVWFGGCGTRCCFMLFDPNSTTGEAKHTAGSNYGT